MKIWRAFLREFNQRQKTVERVASREPSIRAQKGTLESGKQTGQRSTSSGRSAGSAATGRGRLCSHGEGGEPTRRQATHQCFGGLPLCGMTFPATHSKAISQLLSVPAFRQPKPGWYRDAAGGSPMAQLAGGELRIRRRCS
jgi:hypothetical protein